MDMTIKIKVDEVLNTLSIDPILGQYVDKSLNIPEVHHGIGEIKLVILGQDPTVKNEEGRKKITHVLNLNKPGSLFKYLSNICLKLRIDLQENVYATNYFKNFFTKPPTQIKEINIFKTCESYWLPLLKEEINQFPNIPIISLGQPLLTALVTGNASPLVRDYWGYTSRWKSGEKGTYCYLEPHRNKIDRIMFPFPHQPSANKEFYRNRFDDYIARIGRYLRSER